MSKGIDVALDHNLETRIRESFQSQGLMGLLGAKIPGISRGWVRVTAPIRDETGQQQGFAHAGLSFSIGDSAAGYAALSVMPDGSEVVTSEMKIHLLAPARGEQLVAEGRVIRAGKRLVVVSSDVWAEDGEKRTHVATLLGTMVPVRA